MAGSCRLSHELIEHKRKVNKRSGTLYSMVKTAIVCGIGSVEVLVEADVSDGMPVFHMVGFLGAEVKEAGERVRTALRNSGISFRQSGSRSIFHRQICVNQGQALIFRSRLHF